MPARNLPAEQAALKTFGASYGKMPSTPADWAVLHRLAYPEASALPDEMRNANTEAIYAASPADLVKSMQGGITPNVGSTTPTAPTQPMTLAGSVPGLQDEATKAAADRATALQQSQTLTKGTGSFFNTLQNAIRTKMGYQGAGIGESELFRQAGLTGYDALSQSLAMKGQELQSSRADLQNVINGLGDVFKSQASVIKSSYDDATSRYGTASAAVQSALKDIADHKAALDNIQLQQDLELRNKKWELEHATEKAPTNSEILAYAQQLYNDDWEGKYSSFEDARVDARNQLLGQGMATTSGNQLMRTDRNNNPTAMTIDVASVLGLEDGVDFIAGDPWYELNGKVVPAGTPGAALGGTTAKLIGDPIAVTIKGLDKASQDPDKSAFYTASGQPRWTYFAMSDKDWDALSEEGKKAVVGQMYAKEGGNGSLLGVEPTTGKISNPTIQAYAQEYQDTGVMPKEVTRKAQSVVMEATKNLNKPDGFIYAKSTGAKPQKVSGTQLDGYAAMYDLVKKTDELRELDKLRTEGVLMGTIGKVFGNEEQQRYIDLKRQMTDLLARARTGAAMNAAEERFYNSMLPGRFSEAFWLGAKSEWKIDDFQKAIMGSLKAKLDAQGLAISGFDNEKTKTINGKNYVKIGNQWQAVTK